MTMDQYLDETRHAAQSLIECYMRECSDERAIAEQYNGIVDQIAEANKKLTGNFAVDCSEPEGREALQAISGKPAELRQLLHQQSVLRESRIAKLFSTAVMCGAMLQIGKQGLSTIYGKGGSTCAKGRSVAGMHLAKVVWEARNHALHFEENSPHSGVRACFENLAKEFGDGVSLSKNPGQNLSAHVIDLLGWHSYEAYEKDMRSLA